jgi:hypothetical protein
MLQSSKSVVFYVRYIGTLYMKKWKTKYDTLSIKNDELFDLNLFILFSYLYTCMYYGLREIKNLKSESNNTTAQI